MAAILRMKRTETMTAEEIVAQLLAGYEGVVAKVSWGETALFYNPGGRLPNGVYFCTIKEKDGDNDQSSRLDREGVYRLNIGLSKVAYEARFGARPKRPAKGGVVTTGHDFSEQNVLMPHPVYGWMSWVCVLSPSAALFDELKPLLDEAYSGAVIKFNKKLG